MYIKGFFLYQKREESIENILEVLQSLLHIEKTRFKGDTVGEVLVNLHGDRPMLWCNRNA